MKWIYCAFALFVVLAAATTADASIVWNFSGTSQESNGFTPTPTGGSGTISVYAFQLNGSGSILSTPVTSWGTSTLNGLFQVDNSPYNEGSGIAPYNPSEGGGAGFPNQDGITDNVPNVDSKYKSGPYSNFLELQLGSNIPVGTTLGFLMQHGSIDGPLAYVDVYTLDGSVGSGVAPDTMDLLGGSPFTIDGHTNTTSQFSITKDTSGNEIVAITGDCHYLLLDTITGTSPIPEPRFYGVLLAGLLGLAGIVVHNRRRVTE